MTPADILDEFRAAGAYQEGHFVLTSGLHSPVYLQCALALMDPARAARLCGALVIRIQERLAATREEIDLCVTPALGGVVVGYETARQLGIASLFAERREGAFMLRRGFEIPPNSRCLVVEDVVTTGGSVREVAELVTSLGGRVPLAATLIDRSGGRADAGAPLVSALALDVPTYAADALPPELAALPTESPGSRRLAA